MVKAEAPLKNKQYCFVYIALNFHPPVANFAGRGEMGMFLFVGGKGQVCCEASLLPRVGQSG